MAPYGQPGATLLYWGKKFTGPVVEDHLEFASPTPIRALPGSLRCPDYGLSHVGLCELSGTVPIMECVACICSSQTGEMAKGQWFSGGGRAWCGTALGLGREEGLDTGQWSPFVSWL